MTQYMSLHAPDVWSLIYFKWASVGYLYHYMASILYLREAGIEYCGAASYYWSIGDMSYME